MNYFDWQITALRHISTSSMGAAQGKIDKLQINNVRFTQMDDIKGELQVEKI